MDERDWLAERLQEHRPRLRAVAYRMLGSTSEADDAVQEAWIRLSRSNALVAVLDPDIVVREDTGSGTIVEVRGAENVARQSDGLLAARPRRAARAYQRRGRLGLTARRGSLRDRRPHAAERADHDDGHPPRPRTPRPPRPHSLRLPTNRYSHPAILDAATMSASQQESPTRSSTVQPASSNSGPATGVRPRPQPAAAALATCDDVGQPPAEPPAGSTPRTTATSACGPTAPRRAAGKVPARGDELEEA
jgi:hypothetical protein